MNQKGCSMNCIETVNPATEEILQSYALMNKKQVNALIDDMQIVQTAWAVSNFALRKQSLIKLAELLVKNKEKYARCVTSEMGKPLAQAIAEIEKCAHLCEYYAESSEK